MPLDALLSPGDSGPVVNLDVSGSDGTAVTTFSVPRTLRQEGARIVPLAVEPDAVAREALAAVELHLGEMVGTIERLDTTSIAAAEGITARNWPSYCSAVHQSDYPDVSVLVGETLNSGTSRSRFSYTQGASSSLGVGVSSNGAYGTFSASGTHSFSSSATVGFGTTPTSTKRFHRTKFRYGKYFVTCPKPGGTYTNTRTRARLFVGGATNGAGSGIPADQPTECVHYTAGTYFSRTSNSAVTWSNGVNIKSAIGIDLSARTGISTTARLEYWFDGANNLCGWANPPSVATRIEAYAAK